MIDNHVMYLYEALPKALQQLREEGLFFLALFLNNVFLIMLTAARGRLFKFHWNFQACPSCVFSALPASVGQGLGGGGTRGEATRKSE